jgi:hypothetical protein
VTRCHAPGVCKVASDTIVQMYIDVFGRCDSDGMDKVDVVIFEVGRMRPLIIRVL